MPAANSPLKVAFVLPTMMVVRNVVDTPVMAELNKRGDLQVTFLTWNEEDRQLFERESRDRFKWAHIGQPSIPPARRFPGLLNLARQIAWKSVMRLLGGRIGFGNLAFRFNTIKRFKSHLFKLELTPEAREREVSAGNYIEPKLGKPFPQARFLYKLLFKLFYSTWQPGSPFVETFFESWRPDLVVMYHIQNPHVVPYSVAARRHGIPIIGIVASWDQLTTKGPICPGIARYVVQNSIMREEITHHHGVALEKVSVSGWPQMDIYSQPEAIMTREELCKELGISPARKLLVFAAVSERRGQHEPSLVSHLAQKVQDNFYGQDACLILRPHPRDKNWQSRFEFVKEFTNCILLPSERGRLDLLSALLKHADVLLCTVSTIALDAAAFDTCVIDIRFDSDIDKPWYGNFRAWRGLEHYVEVTNSGGVRSVDSFEQTDRAICDYLQDPNLDSQGRACLRQKFLEPLDGNASKRLVDLIERLAEPQWA